MPPLPQLARHAFEAPAWGPALIAGVGCALPLILGFSTGHPGFYWATVGAFAASLADPLKRLGMQGMLILALLGAVSSALGFWAGSEPWPALLLFAGYGAAMALLRRYGREATKGAVVLAICLCLGQGQYGRDSFDNPIAVATLFLLGALGVALLGFGLRGLHGLRMWPQRPPLNVLTRAIRREARRVSGNADVLVVATHVVAGGLAGLAASLLPFSQSQWLTLPVFLLLSPSNQSRGALVLLRASLLVLSVVILVFIGYSLVGTPLMLLITLGAVMLFRLFQAYPGSFFAFQAGLSFLLLSESLSLDWEDPQWRLVNAAVGAAIGVLAISLPRAGLRWRDHHISLAVSDRKTRR